VTKEKQMASINEMRAERARIFEQAKALVQRAETEDRDLSAEERSAWDEMNADIDELARQINETERRERIDAVRASLDPDNGVERRTPEKDFERRFSAFLAGETRSFEFTYTSADLQEKRDLLAGSGTGSNVVPISFVRSLREHLIENSAIRQTNATILTTSGGEELRVPKTTAHPGAQITAEAAQINANDPTFDQAVLNAYKYTNLTSVSREFIEDEIVNVLEYLARHNGIAIANLSGGHFVAGSGSGQPNGVVTAASSGHTAAVGAITGDDLIDLQHSVVSGYRRNSYWLMNDSTLAAVRKLKLSDDQYIWQPGLQQGQPDRLLGRPVVTDPNVPAVGASNKSVVFGDFSGYYIRDVGSVRFERSDDFKFDTDMVTFRAILRSDGELVDENAVKALTHAAS
jgi:HK97 family phage major capsid protein